MNEITLENILANRSLLQSVSQDWLEDKLKKEPFNKQLRALLVEKKNKSTGHIADMIDEIIVNQKAKSSSIQYVRDIILEDKSTSASANVVAESKKENPKVKKTNDETSKASRITGAAIGAGAAMVGSIPSLAVKASKTEKMETTEIVSNTSSIEESGLLGFLSRIEKKYVAEDLKYERPEGSSPAVDPMRKVMEDVTIEKAATEESTPETDTVNPLEQAAIKQKALEDTDQPIFKKKGKKKKGKKKKKKTSSFQQEFRWLSYTPSDYDQKELDPFTVWINSIDDTRLTKVKKKKKKKKTKKFQESLEVSGDIISEPLAELLATQGHFMQSIEMYERLSLKNPEKSSFFADKIESIKAKNIS